MARFTFTVHQRTATIAGFAGTHGDHAQEFARRMSETGGIAEVHLHDARPGHAGSGIVGQYREGVATPEFAGRSDAARKPA